LRRGMRRHESFTCGSAVPAIATREMRGGADGVSGVRPAGVSVGLYPHAAAPVDQMSADHLLVQLAERVRESRR
jgi:hypothetical protein